MIGVSLWLVKMLAKMAKILHKLGFIDAGEIIGDLIGGLQDPSTTEADSTMIDGE